MAQRRGEEAEVEEVRMAKDGRAAMRELDKSVVGCVVPVCIAAGLVLLCGRLAYLACLKWPALGFWMGVAGWMLAGATLCVAGVWVWAVWGPDWTEEEEGAISE